MKFNFDKENLKRTLWHLGVIALSAALLGVLNAVQALDLDPTTLAVLAVVSPTIKAVIEGFRKG